MRYKKLFIFKVVGLQTWSSEEIDKNELMNLSTEDDLTALKVYKEAEQEEADGNPFAAAHLFSRAFKLSPILEEAINQGE